MSMRGKKLEINNEQNTVFFELVSTLDLVRSYNLLVFSSFFFCNCDSFYSLPPASVAQDANVDGQLVHIGRYRAF